MEMFDVHRRDVHNFDDYMNLKKPGFGGPNSAEALKDGRGKIVNKNRKLQEFQRVVKRDEAFGNQVFNPTYKAMGGDLVHKQELGKNPYNYPDPYNNVGIGVVDMGKSKVNEGMCYSSFNSFINRDARIMEQDSGEVELTPLERDLKALIDSFDMNPGLTGIKRINDFCKGRSDCMTKNSGIVSIIRSINDALNGLDNPFNVFGGGSVDAISKIFYNYVENASAACSVIKHFETTRSLGDVTFGMDGGEDFYAGIYGDSKWKLNTAEPANHLIDAIYSMIPGTSGYFQRVRAKGGY